MQPFRIILVFFASIRYFSPCCARKVLDGYLFNLDNPDVLANLQGLYNDVWSQYYFLRQACRPARPTGFAFLRISSLRSRKIQAFFWLDLLQQMHDNLQEMKFELLPCFDELAARVVVLSEKVMRNGDLNKRYVQNRAEDSSDYGIRVQRQLGRLVGLVDKLKSIRRQRMDNQEAQTQA